MKKKSRKIKRTTLPKLLIKSFSIAAIVCLIFSFCCWLMFTLEAENQIESDIQNNTYIIKDFIDKLETTEDINDKSAELNAKLPMNTYYDIEFKNIHSSSPFIISSNNSTDCHAISVIVDKNGNITATNRLKLTTVIKFGKNDPENGIFVCDETAFDYPEVKQLYSDYRRLREKDYSEEKIIGVEFESIYVNKNDNTFIPHKGKIKLLKGDPENDHFDAKVLETKEIDITIDDDNFELIEVTNDSSENYPVCRLSGFRGEEQEVIDRYKESYKFQNANSLSGHYSDNDIGKEYYWAERIFTVYIDKQPHTVYLIYMANYRTDAFIKCYLTYIALFSLLVLGITALYCWRKNIINKTKYAMEDYQRDLTNHLAHDIKTPLMAIGGYAENIMEGQLSDEEQKKYLSAILENVAFTDSIITRTLFLNNLGSTPDSKMENIQVEDTIREAIKKYEPMLAEKNITVTTDGSAKVKADRTAFEKITENLISNAVKYTPENGTVRISAENKKLTITNTVTKKIDTKNLTQPFVRGEKSRSNTNGCGLGLSIAERAASANGFKLDISCTDKEFCAELKF